MVIGSYHWENHKEKINFISLWNIKNTPSAGIAEKIDKTGGKVWLIWILSKMTKKKPRENSNVNYLENISKHLACIFMLHFFQKVKNYNFKINSRYT